MVVPYPCHVRLIEGITDSLRKQLIQTFDMVESMASQRFTLVSCVTELISDDATQHLLVFFSPFSVPPAASLCGLNWGSSSWHTSLASIGRSRWLLNRMIWCLFLFNFIDIFFSIDLFRIVLDHSQIFSQRFVAIILKNLDEHVQCLNSVLRHISIVEPVR